MRRPLVVTAVLFSLGIAAAAVTGPAFVFIYALAAVFLVLSFFSPRLSLRFRIFLSCLVFLLGALWLKNQLALPKSHIWGHIFYKADNSCVLKGFVSSRPIYKIGRTAFMVWAEEARFGRINYQTCGSVRVFLKGRMKLAYGDRVVLEGRLWRPYKRRAASGACALMKVRDPAFVAIQGHGGGPLLMRLALRVQEKTEGLIAKYVPYPAAAVLEAMLLGEKRNIPPAFYRAMMQTGTVHILVVSGFNTSLVIFTVMLLLKLLRFGRRPRFFIALPILLAYCLITGGSTPVVRATLMAVVFMSCYLFRRQPDIYTSLALAALFVLLADPRQLFDIGSQLSFASVIAIVCFYPKIKSLLRLDRRLPAAARFFSEGLLVSASAWLGTAWIAAYYFKIFSPVTVLANIFIVPLAALITLCGFSLVLAALVLPVSAPFFALSAQFLVVLLVKANGALLKLPGAYFYLP